jgi:hypothetical protein
VITWTLTNVVKKKEVQTIKSANGDEREGTSLKTQCW